MTRRDVRPSVWTGLSLPHGVSLSPRESFLLLTKPPSTCSISLRVRSPTMLSTPSCSVGATRLEIAAQHFETKSESSREISQELGEVPSLPRHECVSGDGDTRRLRSTLRLRDLGISHFHGSDRKSGMHCPNRFAQTVVFGTDRKVRRRRPRF